MTMRISQLRSINNCPGGPSAMLSYNLARVRVLPTKRDVGNPGCRQQGEHSRQKPQRSGRPLVGMEDPAWTSAIARMNNEQDQQLRDRPSNTDARGRFHNLSAKCGIVVGKFWAFLATFCSPRQIARGELTAPPQPRRAAQIQQGAPNDDLDNDAPPECLGVMRTGDDHAPAPAQDVLVLIDGQREEPKADNPEYGRASHNYCSWCSGIWPASRGGVPCGIAAEAKQCFIAALRPSLPKA